MNYKTKQQLKELGGAALPWAVGISALYAGIRLYQEFKEWYAGRPSAAGKSPPGKRYLEQEYTS